MLSLKKQCASAFWLLAAFLQGILRFRSGPRLQFAGDLFEPCNGDSGRRTDIPLDELPAIMPVGDPVDAAAPSCFFPGCEMSAISGLECKRGNPRQPAKPFSCIRYDARPVSHPALDD